MKSEDNEGRRQNCDDNERQEEDLFCQTDTLESEVAQKVYCRECGSYGKVPRLPDPTQCPFDPGPWRWFGPSCLLSGETFQSRADNREASLLA